MLSDVLDCLAGNFIYPLEGHYRVWNRGPKRQNCLNLFECHSNVKRLSFIFASFGRTVTRLKLCSRWPSLGLFGLPPWLPSPSAPPLSLPPSPPWFSAHLLFAWLLASPPLPCPLALVQLLAGPKQVPADVVPRSRHQPVTTDRQREWERKDRIVLGAQIQSEPGRQKRLTSDESCLSESQLFHLSFQFLSFQFLSFQFLSFQFLSVSFNFCLKKQNCWTLDDLSRANMSHETWHVDLQHAGAFKSKRSKIEATNKRKVAVEKREFNGW